MISSESLTRCPVCNEPTNKPFQAAFEHFYFYESGQWKFLRGNISTFGFWSGLDSTLCLAFPFYNTLRHWTHRKHQMVIPKGTDNPPITKEDLTK